MNQSPTITATCFAPIIYLSNVADAIDFYQKAFDAKELRRWSNDDGSVHVAELIIQNAIFHVHEQTPRDKQLSPETLGGTSVLFGLFVDDVDAVVHAAVSAGAVLKGTVQDYDYGYRQGDIIDPFGHRWTLEKQI